MLRTCHGSTCVRYNVLRLDWDIWGLASRLKKWLRENEPNGKMVTPGVGCVWKLTDEDGYSDVGRRMDVIIYCRQYLSELN